MAALIEAASDPTFPAEIVGVISDQPEAPGLTIAARAGHPDAGDRARGLSPTRPRMMRRSTRRSTAFGAEIVALAGYMRAADAPFVEKWQGRMINIHPSLLPSFTGLDTHQRALDAGVRIHGCTRAFRHRARWMTGRSSRRRRCRCSPATASRRWRRACSRPSTSSIRWRCGWSPKAARASTMGARCSTLPARRNAPSSALVAPDLRPLAENLEDLARFTP